MKHSKLLFVVPSLAPAHLGEGVPFPKTLENKQTAGVLFTRPASRCPRHLSHFAKHWTGQARWDYYGYHEDLDGSDQNIDAPRNFRANRIALSGRGAF